MSIGSTTDKNEEPTPEAMKANAFMYRSGCTLILSLLALAIICGVLAGVLYPYVGANSMYSLIGLIAIPFCPCYSVYICSSGNKYEQILLARSAKKNN